MGARSNALSELTRFWLQARHGCLVNEAIPVKVKHGTSDIDLVALRPDLRAWSLPDGTGVTRAIVETKDEHDFDPAGRDYAKRLRSDVLALGGGQFVPSGGECRFTMLRQEHYEKALALFGSSDFDRIFVVHALDEQARQEIGPALARERRIHWVTAREIVGDLLTWYRTLDHRAALRHTLMGDLWHLLVGHCGLSASRPNE